VPDSKKREWQTPRLTNFENDTEVWAYYSGKATPEEKEGVQKLIERLRARRGEQERQRAKRRA
jgi:hypothetical protein